MPVEVFVCDTNTSSKEEFPLRKETDTACIYLCRVQTISCSVGLSEGIVFDEQVFTLRVKLVGHYGWSAE